MRKFNQRMIILCGILLTGIGLFLIVEDNIPDLIAFFKQTGSCCKKQVHDYSFRILIQDPSLHSGLSRLLCTTINESKAVILSVTKNLTRSSPFATLMMTFAVLKDTFIEMTFNPLMAFIVMTASFSGKTSNTIKIVQQIIVYCAVLKQSLTSYQPNQHGITFPSF